MVVFASNNIVEAVNCKWQVLVKHNIKEVVNHDEDTKFLAIYYMFCDFLILSISYVNSTCYGPNFFDKVSDERV